MLCAGVLPGVPERKVTRVNASKGVLNEMARGIIVIVTTLVLLGTIWVLGPGSDTDKSGGSIPRIIIVRK